MTKDKFLELYGGWIGFLVISIGMFFVPIDFYDYKAIIDSTPEVSISIFGILLAFMGIILQGQNKTIKAMLSDESNYKSFTSYGSRIEWCSALLTLYSLVITNIHLSMVMPDSLQVTIPYIKQISVALYWGMIVKLSIDLYYYIRLFKLLFKANRAQI